MSERKFFVCKHVVGSGCVVGVLLDAEIEGGIVALLCDRCFWPHGVVGMDKPDPHPIFIDRQTKAGLAKLEGEFFTEAEAANRQWLPKSRAMQFVRFVIQDETCGMCVYSPGRLFHERMCMYESGLTDAEKLYLWNLYDKTPFVLTPRQETRAMRLVAKARANFRKSGFYLF